MNSESTILSCGAENVATARRSGFSPDKLISRFQPPREHVSTLYENFETTASGTPEVRLHVAKLRKNAFAPSSCQTPDMLQAPYLGTRTVGPTGAPGRYTWMSYGQVSMTSINHEVQTKAPVKCSPVVELRSEYSGSGGENCNRIGASPLRDRP